MSYLRYLCLLVYSGVQHILCYVFVLFVLVYVASFSGLSIFLLPLRHSLVFNYSFLSTLGSFLGRA
jgi:hypothetical protein